MDLPSTSAGGWIFTGLIHCTDLSSCERGGFLSPSSTTISESQLVLQSCPILWETPLFPWKWEKAFFTHIHHWHGKALLEMFLPYLDLGPLLPLSLPTSHSIAGIFKDSSRVLCCHVIKVKLELISYSSFMGLWILWSYSEIFSCLLIQIQGCLITLCVQKPFSLCIFHESETKLQPRGPPHTFWLLFSS